MPKSNFFCIAVEGPTVDGREISREMLQQMADSYAPATYTARINCEHIAGYSPEKPFNAYGTVLALETREVELVIGGAAKKLLGLFAQIDANEQLVALNKAGQKLFSSMEVRSNFAGTNGAYLVGLAVTDTPASLGTEPLKFAAMARDNHFTAAHEISALELEAEAPDLATADAVQRGVLAAFKSLFGSTKVEAPKEEKQPPANDNQIQQFADAVSAQMVAAIAPVNEAITTLRADMAALKAEQTETKEKLANEPSGQNFTRTPATGEQAVATDC